MCRVNEVHNSPLGWRPNELPLYNHVMWKDIELSKNDMMNEKNIDRLMYNIANQGETKNTNVIKYTETINV